VPDADLSYRQPKAAHVSIPDVNYGSPLLTSNANNEMCDGQRYMALCCDHNNPYGKRSGIAALEFYSMSVTHIYGQAKGG